PMPAGLLLVLAFGIGLAADGFAVRHLGRLQGEVNVVTLLQLGDDDFDVLLPVASQQKLLRLRVAREAQGGILLHDFMDGYPDFVFVGSGLGLDRESDGRLRKLRGRVEDGGSFIAEGIAGDRFLQFGDGPDIAGMQLLNFGELFALHQHGVLKTLWSAAIEILDSRVVLEHAALHLKIIDAACEGVGKSLENEDRKRLRIVVLAVDAVALAAGFLEADLGMLVGMRENIREEGEKTRV